MSDQNPARLLRGVLSFDASVANMVSSSAMSPEPVKHLDYKLRRVKRRLSKLPPKKPMPNPTPEEIKAAAESARLKRQVKSINSMRYGPRR
jgi:hypothetical protein